MEILPVKCMRIIEHIVNRSVNFKRALTSHAQISISEMYSDYLLITREYDFALFNDPLISSMIKE